MKKHRSPLQEKIQAVLNENSPLRSKGKRVSPVGVNRSHELEHRRNANSIKKVLKELTLLKKELKEMKTEQRQQAATPLDMSQCRKITRQKEETRKSSSPGYSSGEKKGSSGKKGQKKRKEVREFSFSIEDPRHRSEGKSNKKDNQSEEDSIEYNPFADSNKKSQKSTKRLQPVRVSPKKVSIAERVALVESSELYERELSALKHCLEVIPVSSRLLSAEGKLKLNIEMERMSKQIARVPVHFRRPEQYYESINVYARTLNNQLNSLAITLNRLDQQPPQPASPQKEEEAQGCRQCEENERRGIEKGYRREIRRLEKELRRWEAEVDSKGEEIRQMSVSSAQIITEMQAVKEEAKAVQEREREILSKNKLLKEEVGHLQEFIRQLEQEKQQRETQRALLEQDVRLYKGEVEQMRSHRKDAGEEERQRLTQVQLLNKELEVRLSEMREKEKGYRKAVVEKEEAIKFLQKREEQLRADNESAMRKEREQMRRMIEKSARPSSSSIVEPADYYRLKHELEQRTGELQSARREIAVLELQRQELQEKNSELAGQIEYYLIEGNQLRGEIRLLSEATEKYKDKCMKMRLQGERGRRREAEGQERRETALEQISELIRHHQDALGKEQPGP